MLLELKEIYREYERNGKFFAVEGINLCVEKGKLVSIVGSSGSGKSTLLSLIAGLLKPTQGEILWEGKSLTRLKDTKWSTLRASQISYIPQGYSLLGNLTIRENIELPLRLTGKEINKENVGAVIEQLELKKLAQSYPASLSGGERRRAVIARALAISPKLVLADEPTNDLDEETRTMLLKTFKRIADEGTAVIVVTHDTHFASFSDLSYKMQKGKLEKIQ